MRYTNDDFLNAFICSPAPICVRYNSSPLEASMIQYDQPSYAVYVTVPENYALTSNPTKDLLDRLAELKTKYSAPWLPNSTRPNDNAFQNAKEFVSTLPLTSMMKPAIHVASDGEVNFQWSGDDFHIDLGFYGNGKFSFYGAKEGHAPIVRDDVPVKEGIPKDLADFASAV
jgi:hypothetical protein